MISAFEKANPSIKVQVEVSSWGEYWTKLQIQTAGGTAPDVFLMNAPSFVDYARKNLLHDLSPYIKRDNYSLDVFPKHLVELYQQDRKQYGIPRDFDTIALFYNKKLFDECGLDYPTADWTYEDLEAAAAKLTKDTNNDGRLDQWGILATSALQQMVAPLIWSNGGEIFDLSSSECLLDQPVAVETIQRITDWIRREKIAPSPSQAQSLGWAAFTTGKIAMEFNGPFMINTYKDITDFTWDVAPLPKGKKGRVTTLHGLSNVVYTKTKNPEAAWRLVKFLSDEHAQRYLAENKVAIPALQSVADEFFQFSLGENGKNCAEVFLNSLQYARMFPLAPNFNEWNTEYVRNIDLIFLGQATPSQNLKTLARKITEIINRH